MKSHWLCELASPELGSKWTSGTARKRASYVREPHISYSCYHELRGILNKLLDVPNS